MTNIPAAGGIGGVPGSHHAQFTGVLHREHAVVEDQVRTNKSARQLMRYGSLGVL